MKKLMLPLIAFVVMFAVGGGTGVMVMKPAAAATDSTHGAPGDSTAHDSATTVAHAIDSSKAGDSTVAGPHGADSATAGATHGTTGGATAGTTGATHGTTGGTTAGTTGGTPSGATAGDPSKVTIGSLVRAQAGATVTMRPDGSIGPDLKPGERTPIDAKPSTAPDFERMARLLGKMNPRDAAKTIEQLPSIDAARALANMNDKQAAAVLAALAPDKAASLLQSAITLIPKAVAP